MGLRFMHATTPRYATPHTSPCPAALGQPSLGAVVESVTTPHGRDVIQHYHVAKKAMTLQPPSRVQAYQRSTAGAKQGCHTTDIRDRSSAALPLSVVAYEN